MEMLNIQLTSLPIWVKFYNIPLEYWTNTCLGFITSAVGKSLHLDSLTENRTRLSFARICIEVDLNSEFLKAALLNLGNEKYTTVRIKYPWVPHNAPTARFLVIKSYTALSLRQRTLIRSLIAPTLLVAGS